MLEAPKLITSRRSLIGGFAALFAAPAVVKVENLMALRGTRLVVPASVDVAYGTMTIDTYGMEMWAKWAKEISREFVRENLFLPYIEQVERVSMF